MWNFADKHTGYFIFLAIMVLIIIADIVESIAKIFY